jgi:hypothetical protein
MGSIHESGTSAIVGAGFPTNGDAMAETVAGARVECQVEVEPQSAIHPNLRTPQRLTTPLPAR